ncbi:hypothetical protein ACFLYD_08405 [Chloroflexota bacterium]
MTTNTCPVCGVPFEARGHAKGKRYCSHACRRTAYKTRRKRRQSQVQRPARATCAHCKQPFAYARGSKRPRFCSIACRQHAYRRRLKAEIAPVAGAQSPPDSKATTTFPRGTCSKAVMRTLDVEPSLHCEICGRPPTGIDDFRQWRLHAFHESPRQGFTFHCFCPSHYQPGEPEPQRPQAWQRQRRRKPPGRGP